MTKELQIGDQCPGTFGDTWTIVKFRNDLNGRSGLDVSLTTKEGKLEDWTRWVSEDNFRKRIEGKISPK